MEGKTLIILLAGSSGVGTSSVSSRLSKKLDTTHIVETDYIREVLRGVIAPEYSPVLHDSSYNAYKHIPGYKWLSKHMNFEDLVSTGFIEHTSLVAPAIIQTINRAIKEVNSMIIEGVHLSPDSLHLEDFDDRAQMQMFILEVDEEVHKQRFLKRAIEKRRGGRHLEHFKEIRMTHDYMVKTGKDNGIPLIDNNGDIETTVDEIMKHIKK